MLLEKCKYRGDHQTVCSLMIDDLAPLAVSLDGRPAPHNDWGYLMDKPGSLYAYFQRFLLDKYPEIKGTFFLPLESGRTISEDRGYTVHRRTVDQTFVDFTRRVSVHFELAFHGIRHTYMENGRRFFEFEQTSRGDFESLKKKITDYTELGIRFSGGKFPGYCFDETAIDFIQFMDFKWFALAAGMINRKCCENELGLIKGTRIVNIPTNLGGNIFSTKPKQRNLFKSSIKRIFFPGKMIHPEKYLEYLYLNSLPITIQEHFQNQGTHGKRQTPNVYDDISSLERIYAMLRPLDIWYATCSEIARYHDSYLNSEIVESGNGKIKILYQGNWDRLFLSYASDRPLLKDMSSDEVIRGVFKNGRYVFNDLQAGISYTCL